MSFLHVWPARWGALPSVVCATVLLAACGGGGEPAPDNTTPPEQRKSTLAVSRSGELAGYVKERLRTLERQGRLGNPMLWTTDGMPSGAAVSPTANAAPPRSSTLVQETGVDEADLIQTDGTHLFTLQAGSPGPGARLGVWRRAGDGRASSVATLSLPADGASWVDTQGMVFSSDQRALGVVSQHWGTVALTDICPGCATPTLVAPLWQRSSVHVQRVDIADPANTRAGERIDIDGYLVDSRRIGNRLYVVSQHRPVLAVENLPASATAAQREAAIAALTASDLLPRMRRNGGAPQTLLADTDCFVNVGNASTSVQITTVTVFDLASPTLAHTSQCFIGGSEAVYMTPTNLYVATTRWSYGGDNPAITIMPVGMKTDIHKFALADSGGIAYRGSGTVDGHLGWDRERKSYRLSDHNGDLRVLSFTGELGWFGVMEAANTTAAPSPATLTVLRENGGTLQTVATLPNNRRSAAIGKVGEQVYAVRFIGARGYVVTFRRTDPLYVLDLSDPTDPKTVGELEVAGFSDQLFPLANNLLLGVGKDADSSGRATGLKFALFDVADPAAPTQRASLTLGAAGSASALDYSRHGLNMLVLGNEARVALPVLLTSTAFGPWTHGLQRVAIDTQARTMSAKPLISVGSGSGFSPLERERAAQIGEQVYFMQGGTLGTYDW